MYTYICIHQFILQLCSPPLPSQPPSLSSSSGSTLSCRGSWRCTSARSRGRRGQRETALEAAVRCKVGAQDRAACSVYRWSQSYVGEFPEGWDKISVYRDAFRKIPKGGGGQKHFGRHFGGGGGGGGDVYIVSSILVEIPEGGGTKFPRGARMSPLPNEALIPMYCRPLVVCF